MQLNMDIRFIPEWDFDTGISAEIVLILAHRIKESFSEKFYGNSIELMGIVLICRRHAFSQRKQYKKDLRRLTYDIILDYFLIKNVAIEEKIAIIKRQVIEVSEQTFSRYRFEDFNKDRFLTDLKDIVNGFVWE
jgi:hypothetical protein